MIAPKRNHAGHRLYTEEHIQIFEMVNGQGFFRHDDWTSSSIIRRIVCRIVFKMKYITIEVVLVDDLLQALLKFDEITTSALLNEAFSIYATEKVIASIVLQVSNKLLTLKNNNEVTMVQFNMSYHFYKRV